MIELPRSDRAPAAARRLRVDLPGAVPGWLVRAVPGLLVLVVTLPVDRSGPAAALGVVLAVVATLRPGIAVAAGLTILLGVALLIEGGEPFDRGIGPVAWLVLGVHLVLAASALARHVAWRGLVDPRALGRVLVDHAPLQVVAQLLVALSWAVAGGAAPAWRSVGLLALVVLALALPWQRFRRT